MPIFKIQNKTNYVAIPNDTVRDKRLSIESRGVLAYLLTHSNTFEISLEFLQKELGVGRDKLKNIVRELKRAGYLCLSASHNKKGNFSGQEWFVYAESQGIDFTEVANHRPTEKPSDGKTDRRLNRRTENTSDILKEKPEQKKSNKDEKQSEGENTRPPIRELTVEEVFEDSLKEYSPTRAIEIYREIYPTTFIDGIALQDFANRLPEVEESVWRQTLLDWRLNNYKAGNIAGMISRYKKDLIQKENGNGTNNGNYTTAHEKRDVAARRRIQFDELAGELLEREGIVQVGGS